MSDLTGPEADLPIGITGLTTGGVPTTPVGSDTSGNLTTVQQDISILSQNITALNQTVTVNTKNQGSVLVQVLGTFSATLNFQATIDGTNWFAWFGLSNSTLNTINSVTSPDQVLFNAAGIQQFQIICSAYTSGTAIVSAVANQATAGLVSPFTGTSNGSGAFPVVVEGQVAVSPITIASGQNIGISQSVVFADPNNSSTSNLTSGASFTGSSTGSQNYNAVNIEFFADQNCTIKVEQSSDFSIFTHWDVVDQYTTTASVGDCRTIQLVGNGYRVIVTNNGGSTTTQFRLNSNIVPVASTLPRALTQSGNLKVAIEEAIPAGTNVIGVIGNTQGSSTSGQSGPLAQGAVTTANPSYSTTQTSPLSLDINGNLRVLDYADGPVTPGTVAAKSTLVAGQYNTSLPTVGNTQQSAIQIDSSARVVLSPLTNTSIVKAQLQDNSGNGLASTSSALNVNISSGAIPTGTNSIGTVNQGTANTAANAWQTKVTDGTNVQAVKAASTAAVAADPSSVVALSPNSPIPSGSNTIGALTANQSVNLAQIVGTATVTAGVSGLLAVGGNVAAGSAIAGNPVQVAGSDGTDVRAINTTLKATQGTYGVTVQNFKDSGRTYKVFYIDRIAGVITTEALSTMNINSGGTVTTGSSYTVTSGKTLRLQSFSASIEDSTTTAVSGRIRVRSGATVSATSGIIINIDSPLALGTAAAGAGFFSQQDIPDGLEIASGQEIGISQLVSSASSTVSCCLIGYEY